MKPDAAPCLTHSNLLVAEEVIYPDFKIRMPRYLNQAHSDKLRKFIEARFHIEGDWAYYVGQHGRNLVFSNATYRGNPQPSWGASACNLGPSPELNPHMQFVPGDPAMPDGAHEHVMFAASPDSGYFQHWRDRVAMMLVQTAHLQRNDTKYIASSPVDDSVREQWSLMVGVNTPDRILNPGRGPVNARSFIFACDTPLIHPYLLQRTAERMMEGAELDPRGASWDARKTILMVVRTDKGVRNAHERSWLNYAECKPKVLALLDARGQGEILEEWDFSKFPTVKDIMRFWSSQVRLAVGVHGSGLMNVAFAAPNSAVLMEIWPTTADGTSTRSGNVFWEFAGLKGASYWALYSPAEAQNWNVNMDCGELVEAMSTALTEADQYPPALVRVHH